MPYEQMDERQVAAYLHMDQRELHKLASRGQVPCRKVRDGFVFYKGQVDHWVEAQMHRLGKERLAGIEKGVRRHHGLAREGLLLWPLIPEGGIACPLRASSRDSVIRNLVKLADDAGLVYAKDELIAEVRKREELCSTALMPGLALPHPRHPLPYGIAASFVVVGLTTTGVPYGAADGSLTRLFFLLCSKDDRTHLHVLARIGRMLHDQAQIDELLTAGDAEELGAMILAKEEALPPEP
ncbi:MAG: PTS sugar transporter subunit IIA [Phycisphaerae bacterium]